MARKTAESRKGLVSMRGLAAATQVNGTSVTHPVGTRHAPGCCTNAGAGAIPDSKLEYRRYDSAFAVDFAMGWTPGVLAESIGCSQGGGKR